MRSPPAAAMRCGVRVAPSAERSCSSRQRRVKRVSVRLPTLTQAISSTSAAAATRSEQRRAQLLTHFCGERRRRGDIRSAGVRIDARFALFEAGSHPRQVCLQRLQGDTLGGPADGLAHPRAALGDRRRVRSERARGRSACRRRPPARTAGMARARRQRCAGDRSSRRPVRPPRDRRGRRAASSRASAAAPLAPRGRRRHPASSRPNSARTPSIGK